MRILALVLILAGLGAGVFAWSQRHGLGVDASGIEIGWTMYTPLDHGVVDDPVHLDGDGFDAFARMRVTDGRLWLGVAIALLVAGLAAAMPVRRRWVTPVVLAVAAAAALVMALIERGGLTWQDAWRIDPDGDMKPVSRFSTFDGMPLTDARLWLGIAIGLAAAAATVLLVGFLGLRRRNLTSNPA